MRKNTTVLSFLHTFLLTLLFTFSFSSLNLLPASEGRTERLWNDGWEFSLVSSGSERTQETGTMKPGDARISEKTESAQTVRLPHDWAISGPFDEKCPDGGQGKLPWRAVGWYSKTFTLDAADADRAVILSFDGCMAFPEVYVNDVYAGGWDYGYIPFQLDVTKYLKFGAENTVSVRCDARKHGSRWYPGAGIYRNVTWIQCASEARLPMGAVFVSTPEVMADSASVKVEVNAEIPDAEFNRALCVDAEIFAPDGTSVGKEIGIPLQENSGSRAVFEMRVTSPRLWSPDAPNLYTIHVRLHTYGTCTGNSPVTCDSAAKTYDEVSVPFGIRTVEWTSDDGFHLNGKRLQLYGVDLHHDQGICGAASHPAAVERQLRIMKEMGVNAIRTSHNPNSAVFMELCDRMGFIVWDELFDKWDATVDLFDQNQFDAFTDRQARQLVLRDRNHPCVCVWSIGNEVFDVERGEKGSSNPNLDGPRRVQHIADCFRKYDPTRKTAMGCCVSGTCTAENHTRDGVDVIGWNYGAQYRKGHERYPEKAMVYSESASAVSTRGYYELPHPSKKDEFNSGTHQVDGYDWCSVPWGDIPDPEFDRMEKDSYVAGEFVWTGFDYLGEPSPFNKEARSSYFGIVDLCGIPKDRYFLYRSYWNPDAVTVHILPHWNWNSGDKVPVYVYTNGDSAELFLNGRSLGKRFKAQDTPNGKLDSIDESLPAYYRVVDKYRLRWEYVPFEAGTLEAVAYRNGKEVGRSTLRTSGSASAIRLAPEKTAFCSDDDLLYVLVEAVDAEGNLCPNEMCTFYVSVEGSAELVGIGNGNPMGYDSLSDASHSLFYGKAMIILRSRPGREPVKLSVTSEGVSAAEKTFERN